LTEARIRQQVLTFRDALAAEELSKAAASINDHYAGLSSEELRAQPEPAGELQAAVLRSAIELMDQESVALGDVFRDGVREVLSQPEFARSERLIELIDVLEERTLTTAIPIRSLSDDGFSVVIGAENSHEAMRECSIVLARYGMEGGPSGIIAVLGPTRMRYARTIPTVRYLASVLGDLVAQI
jgi:heat-inducible transcriptional repressor